MWNLRFEIVSNLTRTFPIKMLEIQINGCGCVCVCGGGGLLFLGRVPKSHLGQWICLISRGCKDSICPKSA